MSKDGIRRIESNGRLNAIVVLPGYKSDGFEVFTPTDRVLQLGINTREKGFSAPAHLHPPSDCDKKEDAIRGEIVVVQSGKIRLTLLNLEGAIVESLTLEAGAAAVFYEGHSVEFLEESSVLEIKQGPYPGPDKDKKYLPDQKGLY